eukprot:gene11393-19878_t
MTPNQADQGYGDQAYTIAPDGQASQQHLDGYPDGGYDQAPPPQTYHHFELPDLPLPKKFPDNYRGPTSTSNWVLPGKILAGAKPNFHNKNEMRKLADCNITTWVNVTEKEESGYFRPYEAEGGPKSE